MIDRKKVIFYRVRSGTMNLVVMKMAVLNPNAPVETGGLNNRICQFLLFALGWGNGKIDLIYECFTDTGTGKIC